MYAAARRWRDEALVSDQSLFGGHPIDGLRAADELVEFYVNNPDVGSGTFVAKLNTQLEGVSDAAVQVAAELLYVHALVVSTASWSARKKAELISTVTGFRSTEVVSMPSELEAVLSGGAAGPGQAYLNYRWKMFAYLIEVFGAIKRLPWRSDSGRSLRWRRTVPPCPRWTPSRCGRSSTHWSISCSPMSHRRS